jgi:hypothetical protein
MKLIIGLTVLVGIGALATTTALADPQTHGADYKARGMTESRSTRTYQSYSYSAPATTTQVPSVATQPSERRSFSVEPSVKAPCTSQPVQPAPLATRQPPQNERRAMSIEPTPVQTYNYAPTFRNRSFSRGAPYLHADSKARGF